MISPTSSTEKFVLSSVSLDKLQKKIFFFIFETVRQTPEQDIDSPKIIDLKSDLIPSKFFLLSNNSIFPIFLIIPENIILNIYQFIIFM